MISRARIELQLKYAKEEAQEHGGEAHRMGIQVMTDYVALLTIVEALAESDPYVEFEPGGMLCQWCHESDQVEHAESCEWRQARDLVGTEDR